MKWFAILATIGGVLAFAFVSLMPQPADAGWRGKAWRHGYVPRAKVYRAPRLGYFPPRRNGRYGRGAYPYAYYPYWRGRKWGGWY